MRVARFALAVVLLVLGGCNGGSTASPVEPQYRVDTCAHCGTSIKDPRFAAQYRLPDQSVKLFDDPGCLVRELAREKTPPVEIYFHDFSGDRWLPASDASFAHTTRTSSPRGYGWAAYASFADAQDAVTSAGGGELLGWGQARSRIAAAAEGAPQ